MTHWDKRYLDLAKHISTWSKDPSTKVGAVITKNNKEIALGFNGIPSGLDDGKYLGSRDIKIACVLHAEINAIFSTSQDLEGATMYTSSAPCSNCAAAIVQKKFARVVMPPVDFELAKRWNYHLSKQMFDEVGIEVVEIED
jgi:dCMP deaminase